MAATGPAQTNQSSAFPGEELKRLRKTLKDALDGE
jgi:hypothetical protein